MTRTATSGPVQGRRLRTRRQQASCQLACRRSVALRPAGRTASSPREAASQGARPTGHAHRAPPRGGAAVGEIGVLPPFPWQNGGMRLPAALATLLLLAAAARAATPIP